MAIFLNIPATKTYIFKFLCFPTRNVFYTLDKVETMLYVPYPIIYKPNITNSCVEHFIYFNHHFSQSV